MRVQSSEVAPDKEFWKRARLGAVAGFRLGLYCGLVLIIVVPLANARDPHPIPLIALLLQCLLFAPYAGALINVVRVWIHSIFGAALTGCLVLLPGVLSLAFSSRGSRVWSIDYAFGVALMTFVLGSFSGSVAWLTRDRWRED